MFVCKAFVVFNDVNAVETDRFPSWTDCDGCVLSINPSSGSLRYKSKSDLTIKGNLCVIEYCGIRLKKSRQVNKMLIHSALLFLLLAAGSVLQLSAASINDDSSCMKGFWCRRGMTPLEARNCQLGMWCKRKRSYDQDNCPTGFWCKRSEDQGDSSSNCPTGFWCKRAANVIHQQTAEGDCPKGFWCKRSSLCPTGFWCRKRRSLDQDNCPTGFWCKKDSFAHSKRSLSSGACPSNYFCRRSEYVIDQDTPEKDCPDGFWCRKRVISTKQVKDTRIPKNMAPVPPKAPGSGISSDNFNWNCPTGFWCKK
ncbi:uncharacterized protein LOC110254240 [Exaiptasia diaphana]|uniref:Uncharacterized protein n=1 Tax=Exaiptasia diaphana TaxID=2652724 RepID=A0A913Y9I5_EXADI|nr:uncharacterized protein LOC110254240 [Exaiptasia diaphana]